MSELVQSVRQGRLLRLTLNRPEKRNALNAALCSALVEAIDAGARDRSVGAMLLDGKGKSFCAGMDLTEIEQRTSTADISTLHEQLFTTINRIEKPLIGAIHGAALAGGTGLVANCHIVVATPDATFGLTEIRLGLWPFLVLRAVSTALGERRTVELALTGRILPAAEAREMGLIHEIAGDAAGRALGLARELSEMSPTAIQSGLRFVRQARGLSWEQAGEVARAARDEVFASSGFAEGLRAFHEKRAKAPVPTPFVADPSEAGPLIPPIPPDD